ncbi:MAG: NADPH:quinone oxidoreductase family protein [Rhodobiaceae bacterium]|nr:NADPH:quinone oxidoreductase family protein [Rhodobiaceae bacterium]MCC0057083.1 NADPH:quinone oxidoreductase family protein [Rhodobiaceae bacterium]
MKAWVVEEYSGLGGLVLKDVPEPQPGPGQYLVRISHAGVNFFDTLMTRGEYQVKPPLPFVLGIEAAGEIIAAGPGTTLPVGTRVAGAAATGAYAEQALFEASATYETPAGMNDGQAMVLRGNYMTSYYALKFAGNLKAGETVLVLAAAGGVGSAALDIAKALGARVIAAARGQEKIELCRELGANAAYDYGDPDWAKKIREDYGSDAIDVVYDPVGGDLGLAALRLVGWNGRYLVIGFTSGTIPDLPANRLLIKNASAIGVLYGVVARKHPEIPRQMREELLALFSAGKLSPKVSPAIGMQDLPDALERIANRDTVGKVVVAIS